MNVTDILLLLFFSVGLLMATGIGIYPTGWGSSEVRQVCGNSSKSYSLGKQLCHFPLFKKRKKANIIDLNCT